MLSKISFTYIGGPLACTFQVDAGQCNIYVQDDRAPFAGTARIGGNWYCSGTLTVSDKEMIAAWEVEARKEYQRVFESRHSSTSLQPSSLSVVKSPHFSELP